METVVTAFRQISPVWWAAKVNPEWSKNEVSTDGERIIIKAEDPNGRTAVVQLTVDELEAMLVAVKIKKKELQR